MRMRPITAHHGRRHRVSSSAKYTSRRKARRRPSSSSNSNGRPHESQLIPTAPTPPAAAEPPHLQEAAKGSWQSACKSAPRIRLPPAHRRRSTSHHVPQESNGGPGAVRGLHRLFQPDVLPLPPPPAPAPRGSDSLPRSSDADGGGTTAADAAERYWKRVQLLEEEIRRLNVWLGQKEVLAPATECVVRGSAKDREEGATAVTECVRNGAKAREEGSRAATATVTATNRCVSAGQAAVGVEEIVRLEDGSYLHEVRRVCWPWERLAVQVSRPVVPVDAASASEVLDKMAVMRAEDLCKYLAQMMPLKDITGQQNPGEPVRRMARLSSGGDLLEALVFRAMDKLESLVLEGLKIQMASPGTEPAADRRRDEAAVGKDCMVHVVLMQARDPNEWYGAIGDTMIGLIEASLQRKDGAVKLEMQGLHVAGISFISRQPSDGRCMMWSASLRQRKGSHDGDGGAHDNGCRCTCVRNPNRVFQP